jgi:hypothetical protein
MTTTASEEDGQLHRDDIEAILQHLATMPITDAHHPIYRAITATVLAHLQESPPPPRSTLEKQIHNLVKDLPDAKAVAQFPQLSDAARAHMASKRIPALNISSAYNDPEATWVNPDDRSTEIRIHAATALIVDEAKTVTLIIPSASAYARRRAAGARAPGQHRPGSSGPKTAAFDTVKDFVNQAAEQGFKVEFGRTHGRFTHPDHPNVSVPFPLTPSDRRWWKNLIAQIRNEFGIDIRH